MLLPASSMSATCGGMRAGLLLTGLLMASCDLRGSYTSVYTYESCTSDTDCPSQQDCLGVTADTDGSERYCVFACETSVDCPDPNRSVGLWCGRIDASTGLIVLDGPGRHCIETCDQQGVCGVQACISAPPDELGIVENYCWP